MELRDALVEALGAARELRAGALHRPARAAASGLAGLLGVWLISSLLGLSWSLAEPLPTWTHTTGRAPSEVRVGTFRATPGSGEGGLGGSDAGEAGRPGQRAPLHLEEGAAGSAPRPRTFAREAGQQDAVDASSQAALAPEAPEVAEGPREGRAAGEAMRRREAPEALAERDDRGASGAASWDGAGEVFHRPGPRLAGDLPSTWRQVVETVVPGRVPQELLVDDLVSDGLAEGFTGGAPEEEDGGGPEAARPAADARPTALPDAPVAAATLAEAAEGQVPRRVGAARETAGGERAGSARRLRGLLGGWGRVARPGEGGVHGGSGLEAEAPEGGITGGGDPVYVALEREAPLVFRRVGEAGARPRASFRRATDTFWVAETETTQRQFMAVMGLDLNGVSGQWDQPTHLVSWCDAVVYANRLSRLEGLDEVYRLSGDCELGAEVSWDEEATGFRLLTEAEWEALAQVASGEGELAAFSVTNNVGMAPVHLAGLPEEHGLMGVRANAGEWVWGEALERPVVGRSCLASAAALPGVPSEGAARPCRFEGQGHERHLAMGFRLARGASPL